MSEEEQEAEEEGHFIEFDEGHTIGENHISGCLFANEKTLRLLRNQIDTALDTGEFTPFLDYDRSGEFQGIKLVRDEKRLPKEPKKGEQVAGTVVVAAMVLFIAGLFFLGLQRAIELAFSLLK